MTISYTILDYIRAFKSWTCLRVYRAYIIVYLFFSYELSDGTSRQEEAQLQNVGTENEAISVRGSYTWVAPDGQQYTVNFVADENGFRPEGAHIPK